MIRPLRTWHRRLIGGAFLLIVTAAVLALTHRVPDVRLDAWPPALQGSTPGKVMLPALVGRSNQGDDR